MRRTLNCLAVVLTLTGCAGRSTQEATQPRATPAAEDTSEAEALAEEEAQAEEEALAKEALHAECEAAVSGFLEALTELDSRLSVGLNFSAYSEKVGDVRVAYDQLDIGSMDFQCLNKVAVPAEAAFNRYVEAYNTWNKCIGDIYCDNDSITPKLQAKWSKATDKIDQAETGLDSLLP